MSDLKDGKMVNTRLPGDMIGAIKRIQRMRIQLSLTDEDVSMPEQTEVIREALREGLPRVEAALTKRLEKMGFKFPEIVTESTAEPVSQIHGERGPRPKKPSDDARAQKRAAERKAAGCECKPGRHVLTCALAAKGKAA